MDSLTRQAQNILYYIDGAAGRQAQQYPRVVALQMKSNWAIHKSRKFCKAFGSIGSVLLSACSS